MDKYFALNQYKSARALLVFVLALTLVNCGLYLAGMNPIFFSAMIPQLGLSLGDYVAGYGIPKILFALIFTVLPLLLYGVCWYFSKKNYVWLLVGTVMIGVDLLVTLIFWGMYRDQLNLIFTVLIEAYMLIILVRGVKAGKSLNNDFEDINNPIEHLMDPHTKLYRYDADFAKANHVSKLGKFFMDFGIFLAAILVGTFAAAMIAPANGTLATALFVISCFAGMFYFLYSVVQLMPYLNAQSYIYYRDKEDGLVYRMVGGAYNTRIGFKQLKVISEEADCYRCCYEDPTGHNRKMVIPKAYPNIQQILNQ